MLIEDTAQEPQLLRSVEDNYIHREVPTVALIGRFHAVASLPHYLTISILLIPSNLQNREA
jgi:hypothetical protein